MQRIYKCHFERFGHRHGRIRSSILSGEVSTKYHTISGLTPCKILKRHLHSYYPYRCTSRLNRAASRDEASVVKANLLEPEISVGAVDNSTSTPGGGTGGGSNGSNGGKPNGDGHNEQPPARYPPWLRAWLLACAVVYFLLLRPRLYRERNERRRQVERDAAEWRKFDEDWDRLVALQAAKQEAGAGPGQGRAGGSR